jgi:hypothetical protein
MRVVFKTLSSGGIAKNGHAPSNRHSPPAWQMSDSVQIISIMENLAKPRRHPRRQTQFCIKAALRLGTDPDD